jgi:hypothetical protein
MTRTLIAACLLAWTTAAAANPAPALVKLRLGQ